MAEKLALHGGARAIPERIPGAMGGPGVSQIGDAEVSAVERVLRSGKLFRFHDQSEVRAFELEAAGAMGVENALMVNSGTSALICALTGLGIGPGDEVIVPAYTYIATPAAVVAVGAAPVIADIDDSLGLDPFGLERLITRHTRAIIPVHMQGVPCRLDAILAVARKRGLLVVEDCCQCIGGEYRGRMAGSLGDASAWSLNFFKVITCGEGGVVFTSDDVAYERACFASDPALPLWMKGSDAAAGWSQPPFSNQCYRPSELMGAMARVQLGKLPAVLGHTRSLKRAFLDALDAPKGYRPQHVDDPAGECGVSAAILVDDAGAAALWADALTAEGLPCGAAHSDAFPDRHIFRYWDSILSKTASHAGLSPWDHPAYSGTVDYPADLCSRTIEILDRALRFGFNMAMTEEHARQMARAVNKVAAELG